MTDDFFFDPRGIKRETPLSMVPSGQYLTLIDKAVRRDKDNLSGLMIYLKIILGPYESFILMDYFNLRHPSEEAQRISRERFASFLDYIEMGDKPLMHETEIENKVIKIEVKVVEHSKNFGEKQSKIMRYFPLSPVDQNLLKENPQATAQEEIPF